MEAGLRFVSDKIIWGVPMLALMILTGLIYTIRLRGIQFRRLRLSFKLLFKKNGGAGDMTAFQTLCSTLSAAIGTGNIVGVAMVVAGGPGALLWMMVAAVLGMATNFAEATLAVKFRGFSRDGRVLGGPFMYIEKGLGARFKWLARLFAVFASVGAVMGIGTMVQTNSIVSALKSFVPPEPGVFGQPLGVLVAIVIIVALCALVLLGGAQRLGRVTGVLVPFMAALYTLGGVTILLLNITKLPAALALIIQDAFSFKAAAVGVGGSLFVANLRRGITRGIFTNEAGLGSTPIIAATAKTKEPVEQGLITMSAPFIDTIVMCLLSALVLIVTGAFEMHSDGAQISIAAFRAGLAFAPDIGQWIVVISLILFPFASMLAWSYYGEQCAVYLFGERSRKPYIVLYLASIVYGSFVSFQVVWTLADIFNGLMALPNLVALLALSGVVAKEAQGYERRLLRQPWRLDKR